MVRKKYHCIPVALLLCGAIGCTSGHGHDHAGEPSGAACPEESILTYDSFGKAFMNAYCVSCHSSGLRGSERDGAPSDHDFDTLEGVREHLEHIDLSAAAGPSATNTFMPPEDHHSHSPEEPHSHAVNFHSLSPDHLHPHPTYEERLQLGEWLACGAP